MSTQQMTSGLAALRLSEILPDAKPVGTSGMRVRSCCSQWDECQTDDIFVAIVGSDFDGHDFVGEAIRRGASAIVTERLLPIDTPQFIVEDSRLAFGEICHALAGQPSHRMQTFGVSGSNGKTVTSHLIRSIFQTAGAQTGILSSIEDGKAGHSGPVQFGTNDLSPPQLAEQLSSMAIDGCTHSVIEVSCEALAQHTLAGLELDAAIVTNIHFDDLRFHRTKENYRRASLRLLDYLKPTGVAVLNADDPASFHLLNEISSACLTIGMTQAAEVTAKILETDAASQTFMITAGEQSVAVRTSIIGRQHIYNCLAAAAIGLSAGIPLSTIAKGLESARIPGRLEKVDCGQPYNVWVDSAGTPRQIAMALKSIREVTSGRVWCICSTDDNQSPQMRSRMGEVIEKAADIQIVTSAAMTKMIDYEPSHQVLDGFTKPVKARVVPNRFRAIEWALENAAEGDSILIAGCGEKPVACVGERNWSVSDRDICQAWLYDHVEYGKPTDQSTPQIFNIDDYRR